VEIDLRETQAGVTILVLKGRLNVATAPALLERVNEIIESGARQITVDLGDVSLVDSSGIGALIATVKHLRLVGGDLHIARPNKRMQVLLDVTFLHQVLPTYQDVEAAVTDF
jgi:anti-sigma B factor antagonist